HRTFADPKEQLSVRIDLQANFRSRVEILEAVNFVFRQIMYHELGGIEYDESAHLRPGKGIEGGALDADRVELHLIERLRDQAQVASTGEDYDEDEVLALTAVEREAALVGQLLRQLVQEGL